VHGTCNELLANSTFTSYQHLRIGLSDLLNLLLQFNQQRCSTDHLCVTVTFHRARHSIGNPLFSDTVSKELFESALAGFVDRHEGDRTPHRSRLIRRRGQFFAPYFDLHGDTLAAEDPAQFTTLPDLEQPGRRQKRAPEADIEQLHG
jgi:hypothetical protein